MFNNKGHWIDDPLDVANAKPDFSGLGMEPKHKQKKGTMTNKETIDRWAESKLWQKCHKSARRQKCHKGARRPDGDASGTEAAR